MRRLSTLAINLIACQNNFGVSAWAIILAYSICFVSSSASSRSRGSSWASNAASAKWARLNWTSAHARLRAKISAKVSTSSTCKFTSGLLSIMRNHCRTEPTSGPAVSPWRLAFCDEIALPAEVRGPVLSRFSFALRLSPAITLKPPRLSPRLA